MALLPFEIHYGEFTQCNEGWGTQVTWWTTVFDDCHVLLQLFTVYQIAYLEFGFHDVTPEKDRCES
jgi:hypothetical protein